MIIVTLVLLKEEVNLKKNPQLQPKNVWKIYNKMIPLLLLLLLSNFSSDIIQHITAACEQLASTEYVKRHDGQAKIIHQKLAEVAELIDDKRPYYKPQISRIQHNFGFSKPEAYNMDFYRQSIQLLLPVSDGQFWLVHHVSLHTR